MTTAQLMMVALEVVVVVAASIKSRLNIKVRQGMKYWRSFRSISNYVEIELVLKY